MIVWTRLFIVPKKKRRLTYYPWRNCINYTKKRTGRVDRIKVPWWLGFPCKQNQLHNKCQCLWIVMGKVICFVVAVINHTALLLFEDDKKSYSTCISSLSHVYYLFSYLISIHVYYPFPYLISGSIHAI